MTAAAEQANLTVVDYHNTDRATIITVAGTTAPDQATVSALIAASNRRGKTKYAFAFIRDHNRFAA